MIGPIFFEFIQCKGDDGFGEGNFQALFESIELDQMRRGVLNQNAEQTAVEDKLKHPMLFEDGSVGVKEKSNIVA